MIPYGKLTVKGYENTLEWFWYTLTATLAGVGTGLVSLFAATAMAPVLIVLCPSFTGETEAYQATAIALASDILGSAVTTATYIRHRNIDLKRGWIMLACIIGMCTVDNFAAWKARNVVLGGFTLFLTFCIGIRFLVKPSTEREDCTAKGEKLDWKGVAISLFFGLTIGFGTGFVGSAGGGIMMLVVFTAFLESPDKKEIDKFLSKLADFCVVTTKSLFPESVAAHGTIGFR